MGEIGSGRFEGRRCRGLAVYARVLLAIGRELGRPAAEANADLRVLLAHCPHLEGEMRSITR